MGSNPGIRAPVDVRKPLIAIAGMVAVLGPVLTTLWIATPDVSDIQARAAAVTRAHGVVLLKPDQVPTVLADAVIATEDERFYSHHGIDTIGLSRALVYDTANRCFCQGGSTITEQLVKVLYLNGSDLGTDKIVDMVLALKVESILDKGQIMADYLSMIPTGANRYGVTAAACTYFHAPLDHLSLGEYAVLAGVTQAPSIYDPTVNPDATANRRHQVLAGMFALGYINQDQVTAAEREPVLVGGADPAAC